MANGFPPAPPRPHSNGIPSYPHTPSTPNDPCAEIYTGLALAGSWVNLNPLSLLPTVLRIGLYKIIFHLKAFVHESIILDCPAHLHLHCPRDYNTFARLLQNIRRPLDSPFVCYTPIRYWQRQYLTKAKLRTPITRGLDCFGKQLVPLAVVLLLGHHLLLHLVGYPLVVRADAVHNVAHREICGARRAVCKNVSYIYIYIDR